LTAAFVAASWLSFLAARLLHQDPDVARGRYVDFSAAQQRYARAFAISWFVIGAIAFFPAIGSLLRADSRRARAFAIAVLVLTGAMPITLIVLVLSGYFAEYGS
jgi:hypothetical protein